MNDKIITEYPHVRSLLIWKDGEIIAEESFQGVAEDEYHHTASITKSITGLIIGNALENRIIDDLDDKVIDFLPEMKKHRECEFIEKITIENILTMKTGLALPERNSDKWDNKRNLVKYIFEGGFSNKPGTKFNYNTAITHLLSLIIKSATGLELLQYANQNIFQKMGITPGMWRQDHYGNSFAGHSAHFRICDLLKIAKLLHNHGRYGNRQIAPGSMINNLKMIQSEGGAPEDCRYGYLFWINEVAGLKSYFASGFGGQYLYIMDDLRLIIVITSNRDKPHRENRKLIEDFIVPMMA